MRKFFTIAFCLCGASLLTGCCSTRFTSTIQKTDVSGAKKNVYFKIVKAQPPKPCGVPTGYGYLNDSGDMKQGFCTGAISEDDFRRRISKVAVQRYPELFCEASDAIPIEVIVTGKYSSTAGQSLLLEIGTLGIFYGILPLPMSETSDFTVATDIPDTSTQGVTYRQKEPVSFVRKDVSWTTFPFPLGLISIPGESACEKTSEIGQAQAFKTGGQLTLEGFVDAVVASLKNMDVNKLSVANSGLNNKTTVACVADTANMDPMVEKFNRIKALRDNGAISEQEYQSVREKLVNQL